MTRLKRASGERTPRTSRPRQQCSRDHTRSRRKPASRARGQKPLPAPISCRTSANLRARGWAGLPRPPVSPHNAPSRWTTVAHGINSLQQARCWPEAAGARRPGAWAAPEYPLSSLPPHRPAPASPLPEARFPSSPGQCSQLWECLASPPGSLLPATAVSVPGQP